MAIDALGGLTRYASAQSAGYASPGQFRQSVLDSAAQVLGMSAQDVQSAFKSGQSLADLAQQKGISKEQLVSSIASGIQSLNLPGSPDAAQMAQRIVDRAGGLSGHRQSHGLGALLNGADPDGDGDSDSSSGAETVSTFAVVAGALGMSQGDLLSALDSGSTLTKLFAQRGLVLPTQGSMVDTAA